MFYKMKKRLPHFVLASRTEDSEGCMGEFANHADAVALLADEIDASASLLRPCASRCCPV